MFATRARAFLWTSSFPKSPRNLALKWNRFRFCPTAKGTAVNKWVCMVAINCANVFMSGKKLKRMAKPYLQHLKSSEELKTTYEAIRAGFIALALEKNRRATPFVAEARALKVAATKAKSPRDLLK